jgi:hypothetical protein
MITFCRSMDGSPEASSAYSSECVEKLSKNSGQLQNEGTRRFRSGAKEARFAGLWQRFLRLRHHRATF